MFEICRYLFSALVPEFIALIIILGFVFLLGNRIIALLHFRRSSLLDELLFSFGAGFFVLAFINFILGLFGLLYQWLYWASLVISLPFIFNCAKDFYLRLKASSVSEASPHRFSKDWISRALILMLFLHFCAAFLLTLVPDFGEGASVHLSIAGYYRFHHRIVHIPFML